MSQSYTKGCRDCGEKIKMAEVNGRWAAYELDGNGYHTCRQQQPKQEEKQQALTLEQMDIRLKRVEAMLFNQGK